MFNIASNKMEVGSTRAFKWNINALPMMHPETWWTENICGNMYPNVVITSVYYFLMFIMSSHIS